MFSWRYVFHSLAIGFRSPSLSMSALLGKDVGMEIHRRRIAKWKKVSVKYSEHPKKIFGLSIYLNPSDFSPVSTSIGTDGVLDLPLACLLIKFVKKGMNVVDAGANLGYFTLLSAELVGELGTVYAFEPEEQNFKLLSRSVSENYLSNVRLSKQALSDRHGRIKLFLGDSSHPHEHSISVDRGYRCHLALPTISSLRIPPEISHRGPTTICRALS